MGSDALLPDELVPGTASAIETSAVLVTGATGFLGRQVVRELLFASPGDIVCLVRAENTLQARERLAHSLSLCGIDLAAHGSRLQAVAATLEQSRFGLSDADYRALAERIGRIIHCAAEVNWARGYRQLRASNVTGTLEVIRFACAGLRKRVIYTSTIAVCFTSSALAEIDESTDMLPQVEHMPLPYAQTKCISESLLRAAAARGVPVSVVRPALISGHSETGVANPSDLISALIQGCVMSKSAIDTDWHLDCVPVDHVAKVLVGLGVSARPQWELLNLFNERGRHWREVVLWMNLYGYPIELLSHDRWLHRCFDRPTANYSLFGYRRFFGAASAQQSVARNSPAPYESFLVFRQDRVQNTVTREIVAGLDLRVPPLDAGLLERYLEHYQATGLLPRANRARRIQPLSEPAETLQAVMGPWLESHDARLRKVSEIAMSSHNGIFNEVASARAGSKVGMRRFKVQLLHDRRGTRETVDILLKTKPSDTLMQELLVEVASLCDPQLGAECDRFKHELGLAGCHERELALYELADPVLRSYMPRPFGTLRNTDQQSWSIAMQYLPEAETMDLRSARWSAQHIRAVLHGLAQLHAIGLRLAGEPSCMPWLKELPRADRMQEMSSFWMALAKHSAPYFDRWVEESLFPVQQSLIASVASWWPEMQAMPQTMVHNDCNPRNLVLRGSGDTLTPVFFDWELATIDVPQRDVAEILCFMLPAGSGPSEIASWLDYHRLELEIAADRSIDAMEWRRGFVLSLRHLLIHRLPLYTLMQRFRPQSFLPGVIHNWKTLYEFSCGSSRPVVTRPGYPETLQSPGTRAAGQGARPGHP
jgi:thioester reductase-like protein